MFEHLAADADNEMGPWTIDSTIVRAHQHSAGAQKKTARTRRSGVHAADLLWADRFDGALDDVFVMQDEIANAVLRGIDPAISAAEQKRATRNPPDSLDAWDAYQRGLWHPTRFDVKESAHAYLFRLHLLPGYVPDHIERYGQRARCLGARCQQGAANFHHCRSVAGYTRGSAPARLCSSGHNMPLAKPR